MRVRRATFVLPALTLVLAGCSSGHGTDHAAPTAAPGRTIEVQMTEHRFTPDQFVLRAGETVTFRFTNTGTEVHEAVLGDEAVQLEHQQEMQAGTTTVVDEHGDHGHGSGALTVDPGRSATLTYTAPGTGPVLIGCHQPQHWEGGMKATIGVT